MKKSKFTDKQIIGFLKQAEAGVPIKDLRLLAEAHLHIHALGTSQELASRITEVAHLRRRFGYRRLHDVLPPAYPDINHKRIYRLYAKAGLAVRKRRKVKRARAPAAAAGVRLQ